MKVCRIGTAKVDPARGALVAQCKDVSLSDDPDDGPDYGELMMACALGVTAVPYPKTDEGHVEGIVDEDVGGLDGIVVGARDLRSAKIVGQLKPGDVALHSTGPQQAAQVQCKEDKRQVVILTKDSRGKTVMVTLDGANDRIQITGFGNMFEMSREQGIVLSSGGASLTLKDGNAALLGASVNLGGMNPNPALAIQLGPPTGIGAGPASLPTVAARGVTIGLGIALAIASVFAASVAI